MIYNFKICTQENTPKKACGTESIGVTHTKGHYHHDNTRTNKPAMCDGRLWALSIHYIMLIRPQQALRLART